MSRSSGAAWGSLAAGAASVATLPLAIYATRFSESYELLHAGLAILPGAAFGAVALVLSRRDRLRQGVRLVGTTRSRAATAGRALGVVGLCLAAAGVVALGVYGLLEYAGTRS